MIEFFKNVMTMPMLPYSVLLIIVIAYWAIAALGVLDIDFLDFDSDVDLDADVDGDLDVGDAGPLKGLLDFVNVGSVPLTIIGTAVIFKMWIFAYIFYVIFPGVSSAIPVPSWLISIIFIFLAFVAAVFLTGATTKPLRKFFQLEKVRAHAHLIGKECTIKSIEVSKTNGQAELFVDGSVILISARCMAENNLKKGDKAIIMDYFDEKDFYQVKEINTNQIEGE